MTKAKKKSSGSGKKKSPLTRANLDKLTCQMPGCTHESHDALVLHGACHIKEPSVARYWGNGVIELRCIKCELLIAEIALHPEEVAVANKVLACKDPDCKEPVEDHSLVFRSPCHHDAGVFAVYEDGVLGFACGDCEEPVGAHRVAPGGASA